MSDATWVGYGVVKNQGESWSAIKCDQCLSTCFLVGPARACHLIAHSYPHISSRKAAFQAESWAWMAIVPPAAICNESSCGGSFRRRLGLCYAACWLNRCGSLSLSTKRRRRFSTPLGTDCAAIRLSAVLAAIESGRRTNSPVRLRLAATCQASKKPEAHSASSTKTPDHSVDVAFVLIDDTKPPSR